MRNATDITVVLDRSGSMSNIARDMEGGFDSFVREQSASNADDCTISLVQFDDKYETVYSGVPINRAPKLQLRPRGGTALYDAIGRTINSIGQRLANLAEWDRPSKVVVLIITDGYENSSHEFSSYNISEMVKHQTDKYNWAFIFLGANQNAVVSAKAMGIAPAMSMTYAANNMGTNNAFQSVTSNLCSYRSAPGAASPEMMARCMQFSAQDYAAQTAAGVDPSMNATPLTPEELAELAKQKPTARSFTPAGTV